MKVSVILGHPHSGSFNHAIAATVVQTLQRNGHAVCYHDLYAEGFDPILPHAEILREAALPPLVQRHCDEIAQADGIAIVHPNWWGQPPAILKGWLDRVMRPGVAYEFIEGDAGDGIPVGLLQAETALVFNTSNTPAVREMCAFGDPLQALWKNCFFDLCGVRRVYRKTVGVIVTSTVEQRREWLEEVDEAVEAHFPPETGDARARGVPPV